MLTRDTFLQAATRLHEVEVESGPLGLGKVWVREPSAKQRLEALEAARLRDGQGQVITDDMGRPLTDEALFRALLIVGGVLDKAGGSPVLTAEDVPTLYEQGRECLGKLALEIQNLGWLSEKDLLFRGGASDIGQPSTQESAATPRDGADATGAADVDRGTPVGHPTEQGARHDDEPVS